MQALRRWIPQSSLGRTRLAALLFAMITVVPQFFRINQGLATAQRVVTLLAMVLLVVSFLATMVRRSVPRFEPLYTGAAVLVAGLGLHDPLAAGGFCFGAVVTQSLYGSRRTAYARLLILMIVMPAVFAITAMQPDLYPARNRDPAEPAALVASLLMIGLFVRAMYQLLRRQEEAAFRAALLARASRQLLGLTDIETVRAVISRAVEELCRYHPEIRLLALKQAATETRVVNSGGFPRSVDDVALPALDGVLDTLDTEVARPLTTGITAIEELAGGRRRWWGLHLTTGEDRRFLIVGDTGRVSDDTLDLFRSLANQEVLAEASCRSHAELERRAHHDLLTGLPNRFLFFQRLTVAVDSGRGLVLLLIDLDGFKKVNDTHGHPAGDALLIEIASRLVEIGGEAAAVGGEAACVGRFGGDEFGVLLTGVTGPDAGRLADRLCRRLREPVVLSEATVTVGASIGLMSAVPNMSAGDLIRCADIALYSAKAGGKNRVVRYERARHGDITRHRLLEEHLVRAVQRREIKLYYQPHIDTGSGRCLAAEASVRWEHPSLGTLRADEFLPIAERIGELGRLGTSVLRAAIGQLSAWAGKDTDDLRVVVDVPARQVADPEFAATVREALHAAGMAPRRLTIVLTESEQLHSDEACDQIRRVAELGVQVAVRAFAAGKASLASLWSFPVHQLTIDYASSVAVNGPDPRALLDLMASVYRLLGVETLAEGIETEEQAAAVREAAIPLAQGPLYGGPMPPEEFARWLAARAGRDALERDERIGDRIR